jgi:hypothetical protein
MHVRTPTLVRAERLATARRAVVRRPRHGLGTLLMIAGAAALAWSAGIHIHLWSGGYRHIGTIGPLFLMQGIVASVLALVVLATRTVMSALAGVLFLLSTMGGLLLSNWVGLFGLHDHLDAPYAGMSLFVEGIGAALLAASVVWALRQRH